MPSLCPHCSHEYVPHICMICEVADDSQAAESLSDHDVPECTVHCDDCQLLSREQQKQRPIYVEARLQIAILLPITLL